MRCAREGSGRDEGQRESEKRQTRQTRGHLPKLIGNGNGSSSSHAHAQACTECSEIPILTSIATPELRIRSSLCTFVSLELGGWTDSSSSQENWENLERGAQAQGSASPLMPPSLYYFENEHSEKGAETENEQSAKLFTS